MRVVGFDGYRGGWVGVVLGPRGLEDVLVGERVRDLLEVHGSFDVVGVDIPVGLPAQRPRAADSLARKMIGARGSSVFAAPPRVTLGSASYSEANAMSKKACGRGLSAQAYNLIPKVREIDDLVRTRSNRIVEVHPEVSFCALLGETLAFAKKTWNGQMLRRRALEGVSIVLPDALSAAGSVPVDDVLDAAAVAWSARRVAQGEAVCLPSEPEIDECGVEMAIWY